MQPLAQTDPSKLTTCIPSLELVRNELEQVRRLIHAQVNSKGKIHSGVNQLLESLDDRSGKMVRPGLVLLSGSCFGHVSEEHIKVAACVEMVHNATLLHDDVIDENAQGPEKPTVNALWRNEAAVLLGDFLLSHVFRLSSELDPKITRVIADAAMRLCEGELRQVVHKRSWDLSESEYIDTITEKNAVLFRTSCYLGAVLSKAQDEQAKLFADFGLCAGIAFQIVDDTLDIVGDEKRTGKTTPSDPEKHKPTLAAIHLLRTVDKSKRDELVQTYLAGEPSKEKRKDFIRMLSDCGSLKYARLQAREYASKAVNTLKPIQQSQAKTALIESAKFMADRTS